MIPSHEEASHEDSHLRRRPSMPQFVRRAWPTYADVRYNGPLNCSPVVRHCFSYICALQLTVDKPIARVHLADCWTRRNHFELAAAFSLWSWFGSLWIWYPSQVQALEYEPCNPGCPACADCGALTRNECDGCGLPLCYDCDQLTFAHCHFCCEKIKYELPTD